MTYAVKGFRTVAGGIALQGQGNNSALWSLFDTEAEAKDQAEKWLKTGCSEVSVWRQVGTPKLVQNIDWSSENGQ